MNDLETYQAAAHAYNAGDWTRAARLCADILARQADHFEALHLLGIIRAQRQQPREAAELLERAVLARPGDAAAHNSHGNVLRDLGRHAEALAAYERALALRPAYAEACSNRGGTLLSLGRAAEALQSYDRALQFRPDYGEAHYNRGVVLHQLGRLEEAIDAYAGALKLRPGFAHAHYNLGNALFELRRFEQALGCFERALQIREDFADAHNNRGNALAQLGRGEEAQRSYQRAVQLAPLLANAYNNLGNAQSAARQPQLARASFERALQLDPELAWAAGMRLHSKLLLCDWDGLSAEVDELVRKAWQGKRITRPFTAMAVSDDPALQRQVACISAAACAPALAALPPLGQRDCGPRIRVGYYSADFHNHATAQLMAECFELHDRQRFETFAFSFGAQTRDAMRARLEKAFDHFIDVRGKSDAEIARVSRDFQVDIAVDLKGFTQDSRPGIFAQRAAPLQVNYLGHPGTLGGDFWDYLFADHVLIPPACRAHYAEHVVYLPGSYQVNNRHRPVLARETTRSELGLPERGVVFCSFNSLYKVTPTVFDSWMRILQRVTGSVLWLLAEDPVAIDNLRREAQRRGVDAARLVFAPPIGLEQHLARLRAADLCLDTFPCGAHTTASDALWSGVPVITRPGVSFASRVAASLLHAVGMPDLVMASEAAYEALAVEIGCDPARLAQLKARLRAARPTAPLFDTARSTRHLERAYSMIHDRYRRGLAPADMDVPELPSAAAQ
ncbi:MAG: tetratricopeptide repeat protein [Proteobacteria bacterium]|nr:tetratricopeptide repeat protein [Pseudomonadota bacterium]